MFWSLTTCRVYFTTWQCGKLLYSRVEYGQVNLPVRFSLVIRDSGQGQSVQMIAQTIGQAFHKLLAKQDISMYTQYSTDHGEEVLGTLLAAAVLAAGQLHHLKKETCKRSTPSFPRLLEGHHTSAELTVPPQ